MAQWLQGAGNRSHGWPGAPMVSVWLAVRVGVNESRVLQRPQHLLAPGQLLRCPLGSASGRPSWNPRNRTLTARGPAAAPMNGPSFRATDNS
jgi:hypothetical protein